jgi:hypothetical protein
LAQYSGDVHLRHTDLLSDLRLRKATKKPQRQDGTVPRGKLGQQGAQCLAVLDDVQVGIQVAASSDEV